MQDNNKIKYNIYKKYKYINTFQHNMEWFSGQAMDFGRF